MPLSDIDIDKQNLKIMNFASSKKSEDPSSMIIKDGDYILYTKNYYKIKTNNTYTFVNADLFLLCQINDKKQKLQIRFIPCYKKQPNQTNQPIVENKYTFMTTNEKAKKWAESIAQHSIYYLIYHYYKLKGKNDQIINDKSNTSNSIHDIHDLTQYKPPDNFYIYPDCNEKEKEQCSAPHYHQKKTSQLSKYPIS